MDNSQRIQTDSRGMVTKGKYVGIAGELAGCRSLAVSTPASTGEVQLLPIEGIVRRPVALGSTMPIL